MIAALDVHYTSTAAHAAAIVFNTWHSTTWVARHTAVESPVGEYEPGKFYLRELPPLLKVIRLLSDEVHTYVIDGYCHLSTDLKPGLGAYLHDSLPHPVTIVGVAKNPYRRSEHAAKVYRASSTRPLFVTAIGMESNAAAQHVQVMAGPYRIPEMLKAVDRLARDTAESK